MEIFSTEVNIDDFVNDCVDVDKFLRCCSLCPNYEKTWSCPPYDFNPVDYWKSFKSFYIYAIKTQTPPELLEKTYSTSELIRIGGELCFKSTEMIFSEMKKLQALFPGSKLVSGGPCTICATNKEDIISAHTSSSHSYCARATGHPCRFPDKVTYSIESLGGNVEAALQKYFNEKICWGKDGHLAPYYIRIGGLLKK